MQTQFPTFRRWTGALQPWRTSRAQQRSLLRLIVAAAEENLPLSPLVAAWAEDESGVQAHRLERLAVLLEAGASLPEAVEEVHGVLSDEDVLAIRFGVQSGTLIASILQRLNQPDPLTSHLSPQLRKSLVYVALVFLIGSFIITFLQIKIVPELEKIIREFSVSEPDSLKWSRQIGIVFANYWYVFAAAIAALAWLMFSPWPGRRLRLAMLSRLFRPLRDLHMAEVLDKLGLAAQAGRPIAGAFSTLARYHYDPTLRHQLLFIRNEMEQGADGWTSMASIGLINPAEARVLRTADRLGNRPWVLEQLALARKRRTTRKVAQLSELALPVVILMMGGFVLLQALSVFGPLVHIIYSLL